MEAKQMLVAVQWKDKHHKEPKIIFFDEKDTDTGYILIDFVHKEAHCNYLPKEKK